MKEQKPLFIPLKTQYFNEFSSGEKSKEFRRYGARWNEETCAVWRDVVLSKGYGKQSRLDGMVVGFEKKKAADLSEVERKSIFDVYGTLEIDIAVIDIVVVPCQTN